MRIRAAMLVLLGAFAAPLFAAPTVAQAQEVRVQIAPPAPQVEVIPAAPSPQHVWVSGHWRWDGARYIWQSGHWEALRVGYVWSPAHWVQDPSGAWVFRSGQWVVSGGGTPGVVVRTAPPPPQVEVIPAAPSAAHVWIPGHWSWTGSQYVWASGHWQATRHGYYWVSAHWQSTPNGYQYIPGHWRQY